MDRFSRLVAYGALSVVMCVLALLPLRAFAQSADVEVAVQSQERWNGYPCGTNEFCHTQETAAPQARCEFLASSQLSAGWAQSECVGLTVRTVLQSNPLRVQWQFQYRSRLSGGAWFTFNSSETTERTTSQFCPENSEAKLGAPGRCNCLAGFKDNGTDSACIVNEVNCVVQAANARTLGSLVGSGAFGWLPDGQTTSCENTCTYSYNFKVRDEEGGGWWVYEPVYAGMRCSSAPIDKDGPSDTGNTCPPGQVSGQVNGTTVCVPGAVESEGTKVDKKTETLANGDTKETVTTTTTTCTQAGACTTTVTTQITIKPAGGGEGTTTTESETTELDRESFCAENPTFQACKQSEWAGTCGAGFACAGDAVQCAIAREQHRRWCEFVDASSPLSELGAAAATGEALPPGHPGGAASSVSLEFSSVIDQTDRLGGGCPSDVSLGMGLVIPFSQLCSPLQMLGSIMVGLSMLAAAFIVFRQ